MQRKIVEANCSNPVHNKWEQALNGSLLRIIYLKSFTFWNLHRSVHVSRVESFNIPFFPHTVFKMLSRKLTSFLEATESVRVLHAFPFQYCWRQSKTPPIHEARFYSYEFESLEFANLRICSGRRCILPQQTIERVQRSLHAVFSHTKIHLLFPH
jgi:hypothetical protein